MVVQVQPGRATALLGSARAQMARGRTDEGTRAYRALAANRADADATVPALAEVRRGGTR